VELRYPILCCVPRLATETASPGWYNTAAFEKQAQEAGLYAKSINGDAFSNEIKEKTIALIRQDLGQVDLVIYSLASPVRTNPVTGITHKSVLKPVGAPFKNKTVDFHTGIVSEISIEPCSPEDIENTVAVMGGEDWAMWIAALKKENLLTNDAITVAYSYIGPSLTEAVYRKGTIGRAKDHLESTAFTITDSLKDTGGRAFVSVNKALVTQASSAIPVIPLYISLLYKIMKQEGTHEGCIEQIQRLFKERLYANGAIRTLLRKRFLEQSLLSRVRPPEPPPPPGTTAKPPPSDGMPPGRWRNMFAVVLNRDVSGLKRTRLSSLALNSGQAFAFFPMLFFLGLSMHNADLGVVILMSFLPFVDKEAVGMLNDFEAAVLLFLTVKEIILAVIGHHGNALAEFAFHVVSVKAGDCVN